MLANNQQLVLHYLRPQFPALAFASFLAVLLAIFSAGVGAMVGPGIQVMGAAEKSFTWQHLFGERIGPLMATISERDAISGQVLLQSLPMILLILATAKAIVSIGQWYVWERAGEKLSLAARSDLVQGLLFFNPNKRREGRSFEANVSSVVSTDIKMMREYIVRFYGGLPRELVQVALFGVTLLALSPRLFLMFFFCLIPAGFLTAKIGRLLRKRAKRALEDYSGMTEWLQQRLLGIETIKHFRTEKLELKKLDDLAEGLFSAFFQAAKARCRTSPTIEGMAACAIVIVLGFSLYDVATGKASGAVQFSFFATLGLMSQSVARLGRYYNANREGSAAVSRIRVALKFYTSRKLRQLLGDVKIEKGAQVSLNIKDLTFVYPEKSGEVSQPALEGINYAFTGGKIYCLKGSSGAGKSTLFQLLLGLLSPERGSIRYTHVGRTSPLIAYMPQAIQLSPATITQNIIYPNQTADAGKVKDCLERVGLWNFVCSLPLGTETLVGESGQGISGGQAQRILLARLLYLAAPFVLVDEGTSALDPETESLIHRQLRILASSGAMVMTIAHRESGEEIADEVIFLDRGKIQ